MTRVPGLVYDPQRHITVSELRNQHLIPLPDDLPEQAFIGRDMFSCDRDPPDGQPPADGPRGTTPLEHSPELRVRWTLRCREPFRFDGFMYWIDPTGQVVSQLEYSEE